MRRFDYSFLEISNVPSKLINILTSVYSLEEKNENRKISNKNIYSELQKIAIVQSVKGSNAIEGTQTSDERINAIVTQNSAPLNHDEQEIVDYRNVLNLIHNNYENLSFNEQTIFPLHMHLLKLAKPNVAGSYKKRR